MFTYVGLSENQVAAIREWHHVYMLRSGRISISGREYSSSKFFFMLLELEVLIYE